MRKITKADEYQEIQEIGHGYVYNDFSPSGKQGDFNIMHLASCRWLKRSNLNVDKYYFSSYIEAENWLNINRQNSWRKCRSCLVSEG